MKKAKANKAAADMAARIMRGRAEIAMTMLEKLQRFVLSYSSDAEADHENWSEISEDTNKLWQAVGSSMSDLFNCYDELASLTDWPTFAVKVSEVRA